MQGGQDKHRHKQQLYSLCGSHRGSSNEQAMKTVTYIGQTLDRSEGSSPIQWEVHVLPERAKVEYTGRKQLLKGLIYALGVRGELRVRFVVGGRVGRGKKAPALVLFHGDGDLQLDRAEIKQLTYKFVTQEVKQISIITKDHSQRDRSSFCDKQTENKISTVYSFLNCIYSSLNSMKLPKLHIKSHKFVPFRLSSTLTLTHLYSQMLAIRCDRIEIIHVPGVPLSELIAQARRQEIEKGYPQEYQQGRMVVEQDGAVAEWRALTIQCPSSEELEVFCKEALPLLGNLESLVIKSPTERSMSGQEFKQICKFVSFSCVLLRQLQLRNTTIVELTAQPLHLLYSSCPYLGSILLNHRFTYLLQQTLTPSSDPQTRLKKENERAVHVLLRAFSLRSVSMEHRVKMTQLLIGKGYDLRTAMEIVDCVPCVDF